MAFLSGDRSSYGWHCKFRPNTEGTKGAWNDPDMMEVGNAGLYCALQWSCLYRVLPWSWWG